MTRLSTRILLTAFAFVAMISAAMAADQAEKAAVLESAFDGFIRPGYERFAGEAELAALSIGNMCDAPSKEALAAAREQFGSLVEAWSRIEIIRFGPVVQGNRLEKIFFFPDRRGIALKQVQAALAKADPAFVDDATLAQSSVAMQGLGALEYTLFGKGADELASQSSYRCQLAEAVAKRIDATARELRAEWDSDAPEAIASRFMHPGPEHPNFRSQDEALKALLGVFITTTELIADTRIRPFFGKDLASAKPNAAPFWRSALTARSIIAATEGMEQLFDVSEIATLLDHSVAIEASSVKFEFTNIKNTIRNLGMPMHEAATDAAKRSSLNYLLIVFRSVLRINTNRLAGGLGLSAGFSPLDGD